MQDLWATLENDVEKFCTENNLDENPLPAENVFVIDISTWDKIVQILKYENITLFEILQKAKKLNQVELSKDFNTHLNGYNIQHCKLDYLGEEYKKFDSLFSKNKPN